MPTWATFAAAFTLAAASAALGDVAVEFREEARPELGAVRRWADISATNAVEELNDIRFALGSFEIGEGGGWCMPVVWPPEFHRRAGFVPDKVYEGGWGNDPVPIVADNGQGEWRLWLADVSRDYSDMAFATVVERDGAIEPRITFTCKGYVHAGKPQKVGDVWELRGNGTADDALRAIRGWYEAVGQVPPPDRDNAKMRATVLYSTDPLGPVEISAPKGGTSFHDGGFNAKRPVLPSIAALGVNTIWLRPVTDKSGYNPRDYYKLREEMGTPEDFKAYVGAAHALGLGVWHDAVAHGGSSDFPRFKEHPEWLAWRKDGTPWNYWCADFNWPTWVDYMSRYVEHYTREYSLDGWRMDVPYGSRTENWNPNIPYARASYAKLQGGFAQQRGMRAGARRANPAAVTLAESHFNVHGLTCDAIYDITLCHTIFIDMPDFGPEGFARLLALRQKWQDLAGFPDIVRMRYIESHDSLRAVRMYGQATRNLLFALTAFLPGFPMIYEEGEEGSFEEWRRVLALRASAPELVAGGIDWDVEGVPPGVLAFRRTLADASSLVILNFNDHPVDFAGERVKALGWRVKGREAPLMAPYVEHPAAGALAVEKSVGEDGTRIYRFRNGERWFAKTAEGNFESPWIVRHPSFETTESFVYRAPFEGATRLDSLYHPLGFNGSVGAFSGDEAAFLAGFAQGARVKVLDRVGDDFVLAVSVEGPEGESLVRCKAADIDLAATDTGDARIRNALGGWTLEQGGLRVHLRRNGTLVGAWRDGKALFSHIELRTDEGIKGHEKVRQAWDPDPEIAFRRDDAGNLTLSFKGAIRHKSRQESGRKSAPVAYETTVTLSADGTCEYSTSFAPGEAVLKRGVSFRIETDGPDGPKSETFRESGIWKTTL